MFVMAICMKLWVIPMCATVSLVNAKEISRYLTYRKLSIEGLDAINGCC